MHLYVHAYAHLRGRVNVYLHSCAHVYAHATFVYVHVSLQAYHAYPRGELEAHVHVLAHADSRTYAHARACTLIGV